MRRSGMSHMTATRTYSAQASHGLTKDSGMAAAYNSTYTLPLKSLPSAFAMAESLP